MARASMVERLELVSPLMLSKKSRDWNESFKRASDRGIIEALTCLMLADDERTPLDPHEAHIVACIEYRSIESRTCMIGMRTCWNQVAGDRVSFWLCATAGIRAIDSNVPSIYTDHAAYWYGSHCHVGDIQLDELYRAHQEMGTDGICRNLYFDLKLAIHEREKELREFIKKMRSYGTRERVLH